MTLRTLCLSFVLLPLACSPSDVDGPNGNGALGTGGATQGGGVGTGGATNGGGVGTGGAFDGTGGMGAGNGVGSGGAPATGGSSSGGASATGGADSSSGGATTASGGASGDCTPDPAGASVDQGNGTFVDQRTCLMWMSEVWPNTGDYIGKDHAASCADADYAGYDDWRGPDAAEMVSLLRLDGATCGMWNSPNLWDPQLSTAGLNEPVMFYTSTLGDGLGSDHQCAINGNTAALDGGTRKNPWSVVCVRGTSPITGTIASCVGTGCDY